MTEQLMNEIIGRIKQRRLDLDLSYQDLADATKISKSTLQRYETGAIRNISLDKLEILAAALQINPGYLMGWEEKIPTRPAKQDGRHGNLVQEIAANPRLAALLSAARRLSPDDLDTLTALARRFGL